MRRVYWTVPVSGVVGSTGDSCLRDISRVILFSRCRGNITGRTCNMPDQSYFVGSLDFMVYEAELAKCKGVSFS